MALAPLISAQKISKIFGLEPLFSDISITISEGDRVGIIGHNGSGKSTFLRILAKLEDPDSGNLAIKKDLNINYVPQVDKFPVGATIEDVLNAVAPSQAHSPTRVMAQLLGQAGLDDQSRLVEKLSGGQRKRLAITRALLTEPDLLLLDEPTNHLDIAGVEWLEGVIKNSPFSSVFITHDRFFLQNVANRIIEIDRRFVGGFFSANGNYSDFLSNRTMYLEQRDQYQQSLANKVRREVEWLQRGAKARSTKAKARIDKAEELISELKTFDSSNRNAGIEFSGSQRKTQELIRIEGISKRYGDQTLYEDINLILKPGSRLGVVGLNGSGKTSFLRTLIGELEPDKGNIVRAPRLKIALLDQMRAALKQEQTLQEFFCERSDSVVFQGREYHAAAWAQRFLFHRDQLKLPVGNLSGGEQARALIAKIILVPADILILDEPTNDLDITTLEILEESLEEFSGAIVLVTHDRYLLSRVATQVLGLASIPGQRSILYADSEQFSQALRSYANATKQNKSSKEVRDNKVNTKPPLKLSFSEQRELSGIEEKILKAEKLVEELQKSLEAPDIVSDSTRLQHQCALLTEAQKNVENLYSRWDELEQKSIQADISRTQIKLS